jgi:hypothetical protein
VKQILKKAAEYEELLYGPTFPSQQVHRTEHPAFASGDSDNSNSAICFLMLIPRDRREHLLLLKATVSEIEFSIHVPYFSDVELTPFVI